MTAPILGLLICPRCGIEKRVKVQLSPREIEILDRRCGVSGPKETLQQIGESYDVTGERIRQVESKAFRRLRSALMDRTLTKEFLAELWLAERAP